MGGLVCCAGRTQVALLPGVTLLARRTSLSEGARPAAGTGPTVTLTGVAQGTAGRPGSEGPGHSGAQDGARGAPTRSPARSPARPSDLIRSGLLRLGTGG